MRFITSATESREEESRLDRLLAVLDFAALHRARAMRMKIVSLEDHKGELTVTWKSPPTKGEKRAFVEAWKSENEPGDNVYHRVVETEERPSQ
jgi:hypothetical protein